MGWTGNELINGRISACIYALSCPVQKVCRPWCSPVVIVFAVRSCRNRCEEGCRFAAAIKSFRDHCAFLDLAHPGKTQIPIDRSRQSLRADFIEDGVCRVCAKFADCRRSLPARVAETSRIKPKIKGLYAPDFGGWRSDFRVDPPEIPSTRTTVGQIRRPLTCILQEKKSAALSQSLHRRRAA